MLLKTDSFVACTMKSNLAEQCTGLITFNNTVRRGRVTVSDVCFGNQFINRTFVPSYYEEHLELKNEFALNMITKDVFRTKVFDPRAMATTFAFITICSRLESC